LIVVLHPSRAPLTSEQTICGLIVVVDEFDNKAVTRLIDDRTPETYAGQTVVGVRDMSNRQGIIFDD
jgi:hypothetical protein